MEQKIETKEVGEELSPEMAKEMAGVVNSVRRFILGVESSYARAGKLEQAKMVHAIFAEILSAEV